MDARIVRPANYPSTAPGKGWCVAEAADGTPVAVINLLGKLFLDPAVSPFAVAEDLVRQARERAAIVLVDFHAEATSEKVAMGRLLAGSVSAVLGTHTHIQTNDAQILPGGTAYITDAGMTGPHDSVIGVRTDLILRDPDAGPVRARRRRRAPRGRADRVRRRRPGDRDRAGAGRGVATRSRRMRAARAARS
jgi:metallophosphoesterase (TIGR00282 family)